MKKISILRIASFCILLLMPLKGWSEISVIVHPDNDAEISEKAILNIFLGKARTYSNGEQALPLTLDIKDKQTNEFTEKFLEKTVNQFRSYWARMMFSGAGVPPKTIDDADEMLELVASNPNLIGFVNTDDVDDTVKVVMKK